MRAPCAALRHEGLDHLEPEGEHTRGVTVATVAGGHRAGVQAVHRDPGPLEPPGQLGGEVDVGQLRLGVDLHGAVARVDCRSSKSSPRRAPLWAVDATFTTRAGALSLDPVEEQLGQEEGTEVVDGEGRLESVGRLAAVGQDDPGVVDQDVDPAQRSADVGRPGPDRGQVTEVEDDDLDVSRCRERARISATAASPRPPSRAVISVLAPARARATAVSRPIPEFPPVMITVLPVMSSTP